MSNREARRIRRAIEKMATALATPIIQAEPILTMPDYPPRIIGNLGDPVQ